MATIFTVDDDREIMSIYRDILQIRSHDIVAEAQDGKEAVEIFEKMKTYPDIIIMDHRMPAKNGLEAMKDIMEINPLQVIIFVTADDEAAKNAMKNGASDFILKPFKMNNIFNAIENTVSGIQKNKIRMRETLLRIATQIKSSDPDTLKRACDMIENDIIDKFIHSINENGELNLNKTSNWSCIFMNIAGFDFSYSEMENGNIQIINNKCLWMEKFGSEPVYCHLSRGLLTRFALKVNLNVTMEVHKTLMNNDDCCHFELKV